MKQFFTFASFAASAQILCAATINNVIVRQNWPWSHDVNINYSITGTDSAGSEITVEAYNGEKLLCKVPSSNLSGDTCPTTDGLDKRIVMSLANLPAFTNDVVLTNFKVRLSLFPGSEILYKIIDLKKRAGEEGQVVNVTVSDLTNGLYGAWEKSPPSWVHHTEGDNTYWDPAFTDTYIWTGVTNNNVYRTTKYVMRHIPAGTFKMSSPSDEPGRDSVEDYQHTVCLTKDFYIGIYEMSCMQFTNFIDETHSFLYIAGWPPATQLSYVSFRGDRTNEDGTVSSYFWPWGGHSVAPTSYFGRARSRLGLAFDFPTEAQWEYACRAGTTGSWNNGTTITNAAATNDVNLDVLAWYYRGNGITPKSGLFLPNAWGLYDMHGSEGEATLDTMFTYPSSGTVVTNPVGGAVSTATSGIVVRGGNYGNMPVKNLRAARRSGVSPYSNGWDFGIRLVMPVGNW